MEQPNTVMDAPPEAQDATARRQRASEAEGDGGFIKVKLPSAVGAKVREKLAELRAKDAVVTAEEFLAEYLDCLPDSYLEEQAIKFTPEDYYLTTASKIPEIREILIRHAKRALARKSGDVLKRKKAVQSVDPVETGA